MIALASDHGGFGFKEKTKEILKNLGLKFQDFGTNSTASTDYPDYAHVAAEAIANGKCDRGIFVCGSGIGVCIVANKHNNVRAAMCESVDAAELSRQHNNANVLCFGERLVSWETAEAMIKIFLSTQFEGGRHERRIEKIHTLTGL